LIAALARAAQDMNKNVASRLERAGDAFEPVLARWLRGVRAG
jgi:hypothetical protein